MVFQIERQTPKNKICPFRLTKIDKIADRLFLMISKNLVQQWLPQEKADPPDTIIGILRKKMRD